MIPLKKLGAVFMTLEELKNFQLLKLYRTAVRSLGEKDEYTLELQEEIFSRMEGGEDE